MSKKVSKKRLAVVISGKVQGVFFRAETQKKALLLDVTGWVKNLPDGRVEALFEGEEEALQAILEWCHRGPPRSRPDTVESRWGEWRGEFNEFRISYF